MPQENISMTTPKPESLKAASAVLLIVSSITLAFYQTIVESDIADGVLMYIAQAFLLAGSLFGIDYYIEKLRNRNETNHFHYYPKGNQE